MINLRTSEEYDEKAEADAVEAAGMDYVQIPISRTRMNLADAAMLQEALDRAPSGAVLIHCGSGNRVGALWGLMRAWQEGDDADAARAIGQKSGYRGDWADPRFQDALRPLDPAEPGKWDD